jgi:hypothetical protein
VRGGDEFVMKPMHWHRSKSTTRLNIATSAASAAAGGSGSSGAGSNSTDDEIQVQHPGADVMIFSPTKLAFLQILTN